MADYVPGTEARFWAKVEKTEGCWNWTAAVQGRGYGKFGIAGRFITAHRWAFESVNGPIPPGLHVCHRCDNVRCVRPDHLFLGTRSDNMRDCAAKGRNVMQLHPERSYFKGRSRIQPRGEQQGSSKLTTEMVLEMRRLHGEGLPTAEIARRFPVQPAHVRNVVSRRSWRHV